MNNDKQNTDEVTTIVPKRMSRDEYLKPALKKGDNTKYLRNALDCYSLPPIDISDPEQVAERINWYFNNCLENDAKPGVVGLCNSLGITRMTFFNWQKGTRDRKEHQILAMRAKCIIESLYEQYMMNGKINPVSGIFLMKNNFEGYYDRQDVVVSPGASPLEPQKNEAELKEKYSANDVEDE